MLLNNKRIVGIVLVFITLFSVCSVFSSCNSGVSSQESTVSETKPVTVFSLYFASKNDIKFDSSISEKRIYLYSADSDIVDIKDDLEFISEDENIATVEYDNNSRIHGCVKISKVSAGQTVIYVRNSKTGAQTDKLNVIVEVESTTEPPSSEAKPETADKTTVPRAVNQNDDYQANDNGDNNDNHNGQTVYITPSGKKYHYKKSCAGKNAMERDINKVKNSYDPCKKCAN